MKDPENQRCFDCGEPNPVWCSLNNGVYLCMKCAAGHRSYGVHISFVRSLKLDTFKPSQLVMMHLGGNRRAREYFKEHPFNPPPLCVKYDCENADAYRRMLRKECSEATGEEFPELPPWRPTPRADMGRGDRPVVGGGHMITESSYVPSKRQPCLGSCAIL